MKLYVTIIEIDSAVYAEVDLTESKTPEEIRAWHIANYVASGLYDESATECSAMTIEATQTGAFWKAMGDYITKVAIAETNKFPS